MASFGHAGFGHAGLDEFFLQLDGHHDQQHSTDRQFSWDEWKTCALPIFKTINLKKQLEKASAANGDQPEVQQKAAEKGDKGTLKLPLELSAQSGA